jgi:hypothetical protein
LPPEDVTALDAAMQMLGLPTNKFTDRQRKQSQLIEFEKFYSDRSADIKRAYVKAYRSNNPAAMREAQDEWRSLQEGRSRNGFRPQPLSLLYRAPMEARKREANAIDGVAVNRNNRQFLQEVAR